VGPAALSLAVAALLGFVGAFSSGGSPLLPRMAAFLALGAGCALMVSGCLWASDRIAWLRTRPVARRIAVGLVLTPLVALWVWAAVGFGLMGGPRLGELPRYLGYSAGIGVAMTALSWAVFRARGSKAPPSPPPEPRFADRLPFRLRDAELYAVEADDHYLRVRTSKGSDLILMRLSDAVLELDGAAGAQTHRSWWVAKAAVADVRRRDGKLVLVLKDGAEAPVSRTYANALRDAGWF
jgi:hypothetical protein